MVGSGGGGAIGLTWACCHPCLSIAIKILFSLHKRFLQLSTPPF